MLTPKAQALVAPNPQGSAAQPDMGDEVARLLADVFTDESLDRTARRIMLGGCARHPHPSITVALSAVVAHPAPDPGTRRLALAHLAHRDPESAVGAWLALPPTVSSNPALLRVLLEVSDPTPSTWTGCSPLLASYPSISWFWPVRSSASIHNGPPTCWRLC
jgi:hypothetical protein